ncbi:MAG: choice-of-anchor Q domain-containing protein [Acidobacteriota bacterium]
MGYKVIRKLLLAIGLIFPIASFCSAADIYIAQNAVGADTGADCTNAHSATWFNTAANWGVGSGLISAGDTVHWCGTYTGTAGQTGLTFQGNGSPGSPITLLFEPGAVMTAPYWAVAIDIGTSRSYITIDGGPNGIIENTANGTNLANKQQSRGVVCSKCNDIEIRNLTIRNLYIRQGGSSEQVDGGLCIHLPDSHNNIVVHHSTLSEASMGIIVYPDRDGIPRTGWEFHSNTLIELHWGIASLSWTTTQISDGILIHDNEYFGNSHWDDPTFFFHNDGIFLSADNGSEHRNCQVYNNYLHGTMAPNTTAQIYLSTNTKNCRVYNNVMEVTSGTTSPGTFYQNGGVSNEVYNNTVVGGGSCYNAASSSNIVLKNNICVNSVNGIFLSAGSTLAESDFNVFFNVTGQGSCGAFCDNGANLDTLTAWQNFSGKDLNSTTADPKLDPTSHLQAGSSAIGLGANLTSLGIATLNSDKDGNARPSSGPWDAGAYQFAASVRPQPPSNLTSIVK